MNYVLKLNTTSNSYFAEKVDLSDKSIASKVFEGSPFSEPALKIELPNTKGKLLSFIDNVNGFLILDEVLYSLLVKYGTDFIETYPVSLKKRIDKKYFLVNILNNIDCIDFHKSICQEYIPNSKIFWKVDKLVLDESKISGRHFFRINNIRTEIIISNELKLKIEELEYEGISFVPINEYQYDRTKSNIS